MPDKSVEAACCKNVPFGISPKKNCIEESILLQNPLISAHLEQIFPHISQKDQPTSISCISDDAARDQTNKGWWSLRQWVNIHKKLSKGKFQLKSTMAYLDD